VGAALSCEVLGEGHAGVCVKFDVVGAAAVVLVCSSAPLDRSDWVLIVGHFVVVRVGIIKSVWLRSMHVCRVPVCGDDAYIVNYIYYFRRCECI